MKFRAFPSRNDVASLPIQCLRNAPSGMNVYEKSRQSYSKCYSWGCKRLRRKCAITSTPPEALVRIHNVNNKDAREAPFSDLEYIKKLLKFLVEADGAIAHTIDESYGFGQKFWEHLWDLESTLNGLHRMGEIMDYRMLDNEVKSLLELLANHHRLC